MSGVEHKRQTKQVKGFFFYVSSCRLFVGCDGTQLEPHARRHCQCEHYKEIKHACPATRSHEGRQSWSIGTFLSLEDQREPLSYEMYLRREAQGKIIDIKYPPVGLLKFFSKRTLRNDPSMADSSM